MSEPQLNARLDSIPVAATMAAAARARALRAQGIDIISLTLGEPGFDTPAHIIEAAHQAALRGETKYPPVNGTPALLEAVAGKFRRDNGLQFATEELIVGHGARQIIYDALTASLEPGTEIVIPAPYWNAYPLIARMAGAVPKFVPCAAAPNFLPSAEAIHAAINKRTRWLILNFPGNPTGAICPPDHLRAIAETLRAHPHVWIMSDDIYEHLIHDGTPHVTLAEIAPDLAPRILTVSGVSKTYAMTGWRVGFAGGPARLIRAMSRVQGQSTGGVSPIAQAAATAALTGPQDLVTTMRSTYAARGRAAAAALNTLPGIACPTPQAAFYVFPDITGLYGKTAPGGRVLTSDEDVTEALLEDARIACVAGTAFGAPGHIRLSTAGAEAALSLACHRIGDFVAGLT